MAVPEPPVARCPPCRNRASISALGRFLAEELLGAYARTPAQRTDALCRKCTEGADAERVAPGAQRAAHPPHARRTRTHVCIPARRSGSDIRAIAGPPDHPGLGPSPLASGDGLRRAASARRSEAVVRSGRGCTLLRVVFARLAWSWPSLVRARSRGRRAWLTRAHTAAQGLAHPAVRHRERSVAQATRRARNSAGREYASTLQRSGTEFRPAGRSSRHVSGGCPLLSSPPLGRSPPPSGPVQPAVSPEQHATDIQRGAAACRLDAPGQRVSGDDDDVSPNLARVPLCVSRSCSTWAPEDVHFK